MKYKDGFKSRLFWLIVALIFILNYVLDYIDICNEIGCVFSIGILLAHLVYAIILISILYTIFYFSRLFFNKNKKKIVI